MGSVYTVSQVTSYIKNMFTQDFALNRVSIKGEVSNCKYHTSGHIYFTLKDGGAQIAAVMFAGQRKGLAFDLEEGQEVTVTGNVDVYERDGRYQLYASEIELAGRGDLYVRFEKLLRELEEMGMFAPEYKQPIPPYAKTIGIVTAPTGAAIRDIIHIAKRRNPYVKLLLSPALVQGEEAAPSIAAAIRRLEKEDVDVIIVGRGGGSMEDLWAFNEEEVARAIFHCPVPVISAVGHETDTTIADYVADLRAPTPSAAAELAVFDACAVKEEKEKRMLTLQREMERRIQTIRMQLSKEQEIFRRLHPGVQIAGQRRRLADLELRVREKMEWKIQRNRQRLAMQMEVFAGLSPMGKLNQGYAFVTGEDQQAVRSISGVRQGEHLTLYVRDGTIDAVVERTRKKDDGD